MHIMFEVATLLCTIMDDRDAMIVLSKSVRRASYLHVIKIYEERLCH